MMLELCTIVRGCIVGSAGMVLGWAWDGGYIEIGYIEACFEML